MREIVLKIHLLPAQKCNWWPSVSIASEVALNKRLWALPWELPANNCTYSAEDGRAFDLVDQPRQQVSFFQKVLFSISQDRTRNLIFDLFILVYK